MWDGPSCRRTPKRKKPPDIGSGGFHLEAGSGHLEEARRRAMSPTATPPNDQSHAVPTDDRVLTGTCFGPRTVTRARGPEQLDRIPR